MNIVYSTFIAPCEPVSCSGEASLRRQREREMFRNFITHTREMTSHRKQLDSQVGWVFESANDDQAKRRLSQVSWQLCDHHRVEFDRASIELVTLISRLAGLPVSNESRAAWLGNEGRCTWHACPR